MSYAANDEGGFPSPLSASRFRHHMIDDLKAKGSPDLRSIKSFQTVIPFSNSTFRKHRSL